MLPKKMLPAKCSPKNALQKMLPKTKCSLEKMLPVKMLSIKMLPEKNFSQEKMLPRKNSCVDRVDDRYSENSFKSVDEGR